LTIIVVIIITVKVLSFVQLLRWVSRCYTGDTHLVIGNYLLHLLQVQYTQLVSWCSMPINLLFTWLSRQQTMAHLCASQQPSQYRSPLWTLTTTHLSSRWRRTGIQSDFTYLNQTISWL